MAKTLTMDELRKMQIDDLKKEVAKQRRSLTKMRLAVKGGKQKNTHLLQGEKLQLARMLTVLSELRNRERVSRMHARDERTAISDKQKGDRSPFDSAQGRPLTAHR